MASKRPASRGGRAVTGSNAAPTTTASQAPPRARSAMARAASNPTTQAMGAATTDYSRNTSGSETEKNIQVVLRCRGRSDREIQENSPTIVTTKGAKGKDIEIEASAPTSTFGIVTAPPTRTYSFDMAFGPTADQAMIYHEVVGPMLDEVLMGYNCTLFAYGQTGTGKTYTMQGDLNLTPMGNPSANAGMIPRVLFRLFHALENSKSDYSVKISYIELYNEELRDLLADDLAPPSATTQPMGRDGKGTDSGLKIFDDTNKRGVTIQGLEETAVKDCQTALNLLTKGSLRRQIAATKFNDHSSRSHSIFTITVHLKEQAHAGEDLLKVGKLNLVDLAGSENIGRSGAENKRAREAGMINQSLLTLGRVINALVDKASHVPYRQVESKLTRLLQDSLGGHTKTCIIATISPARSNLEETLSTLDYAIRAKSIRNRPEVNQRTTRNSLLKDYVAEIERLRADLLAAREKNGIFFAEETWNQMVAEQEIKATELEEAKKQVEIVETKLRGVQDEFEQSIGVLKIRDGELKHTREQLQDAQESLVEKENELATAQTALQEETILKEAHQSTEVALDIVANGLKKAAEQTGRDLKNLFEKLERKSSVLKSNTELVSKQHKVIGSTRQSLSRLLDDFMSSMTHSLSKLREESQATHQRELDVWSNNGDKIEEKLTQLQASLDLIQGKDASENDALQTLRNLANDTREIFLSQFNEWSLVLHETCDKTSQSVEAAGTGALIAAEQVIKNLASLVENIVQEVVEQTESQKEMIQQADLLAQEAAQNELSRLKKQNSTLVKMVESEKVKAVKAKDELLSRVSSLLGDFTADRDRSLREALVSVQSDITTGETEVGSFKRKHTEMMENLDGSATQVQDGMQQRRLEGKRTRDGALKKLEHAREEMNEAANTIRVNIAGSLTTYSTQVEEQVSSMESSYASALEEHGRAKRARIDATNALGADVISHYQELQADIEGSCQAIESISDYVMAETSELQTAVETCSATATSQLESIQKASKVVLEDGTQQDKATGTTPRKQARIYQDHWELTRPHPIILAEWRAQQPPVASSRVTEDPVEEKPANPLEQSVFPTLSATDDLLTSEELPSPVDTFEPENIPVDTRLSTGTVAAQPPVPVVPPTNPPEPRLPAPKSRIQRRATNVMGTLTDARNTYNSRMSYSRAR